MGVDHQLEDCEVVAAESAGNLDVADLIVAYLEQIGVEYIFGIPGGAIEPLYNALARSERRGGLRAVVARHETDAAFMADGYARNSGKLGVCCATTGPGATNLITGVASAYENHTPLLVITAQTALSNFGRGAFQDSSCTGINTVGMFEYCTRYNTLVSHQEQAERKLVSAIMAAFQSPTGPSHVSFPLDVLRGNSNCATPAFDIRNLLSSNRMYDPSSVERLAHEISTSRGVAFVIGEGVGEAIGTILEIALAIQAKIVVTPHGKGLVSPYHPLFQGVVGFAGHASAIDALRDKRIDTVIAVGTTLTESATDGWNAELILNQRLIHVDASEENLKRSPMARLHVRGHLASIFEGLKVKLLVRELGEWGQSKQAVTTLSAGPLVKTMPAIVFDEPAKMADDGAPIKPQRLMHDLPRLFPPHTHYLADSGNSMAWTIHYLHPHDRRIAGRRKDVGSTYWNCLEYASMGWAIGAALGTALAKPGAPVVCITGDGSFLMAGQEITTALQLELPVIFVVLNDSSLGMVKHGQRIGGAEPIGYDLPKVNFAALAQALGAEGYVINAPADLAALDIPAICAKAGPTLLDVRVDPEEVPPMSSRLKTLMQVRASLLTNPLLAELVRL